MKTNRRPILLTAVLGLSALATVGCAKEERTAAAPPPPAPNAATTPATTTVPEPATTLVPVAANSSPAAIATRWLDIKDCTYDMRTQFFAGLTQLEAQVDAQVSELTAKRAAMKSTANTKDWDFAMKEMENARSALKSMGEVLNRASPETWAQEKDRVALKSMGEVLNRASPETWAQEKDRVGQAWVRTQEAYDKVKSSMTS